MLSIVGKNDRAFRQNIIEEFYNEVKDDYNGYIYVGYPVYTDFFTTEPVKIDALLISNKGVLIIHISEEDLVDFEEIQDNLINKVEIKLRNYKFLVNRRQLTFYLDIVSVCNSSNDKDNVLKDSKELVEFCKNNLNDNIDNEKIRKINSAIQEAYGLSKRLDIDFGIGTKSESIFRMNDLIETHDPCQMEAILADPTGIQRIRGMAGSGKTIVLARKAVELHTAHPDWKILVTYNTRTVKPMLENLIDRLYRKKNDGEKPNYDNLNIMHGWGSSSSQGFYYYLCKYYNIVALSFGEAKARFSYNRAFEGVCNLILESVDHFDKIYDCILIDEAQDFPIPFFKLCQKSLGRAQRLVYAYDELQKLNEEAMPIPQKIFGTDISIDTPLRVCYRNQSSVIVTAHAIGMGIYRDTDNQNDKLIQLPDSNEIWNVIGYECDNRIIAGNEVELYRSKDTSPDYLNVDISSLVTVYKYNNMKEQYNELFKLIYDDVKNEKVPMNEIMIIDMDLYEHKSNFSQLKFLLMDSNYSDEIDIHLAGNLNPEDFSRDNSIVYSSIHRAKGNEAFVVYIVNSQETLNSLFQLRTGMNYLQLLQEVKVG